MTVDHTITARVIVGLESAAEHLRGQIDGAIESRAHDQELSRHIRKVEAAARLLAGYAEYAQGVERAMKLCAIGLCVAVALLLTGAL